MVLHRKTKRALSCVGRRRRVTMTRGGRRRNTIRKIGGGEEMIYWNLHQNFYNHEKNPLYTVTCSDMQHTGQTQYEMSNIIAHYTREQIYVRATGNKTKGKTGKNRNEEATLYGVIHCKDIPDLNQYLHNPNNNVPSDKIKNCYLEQAIIYRHNMWKNYKNVSNQISVTVQLRPLFHENPNGVFAVHYNNGNNYFLTCVPPNVRDKFYVRGKDQNGVVCYHEVSLTPKPQPNTFFRIRINPQEQVKYKTENTFSKGSTNATQFIPEVDDRMRLFVKHANVEEANDLYRTAIIQRPTRLYPVYFIVGQYTNNSIDEIMTVSSDQCKTTYSVFEIKLASDFIPYKEKTNTLFDTTTSTGWGYHVDPSTGKLYQFEYRTGKKMWVDSVNPPASHVPSMRLTDEATQDMPVARPATRLQITDGVIRNINQNAETLMTSITTLTETLHDVTKNTRKLQEAIDKNFISANSETNL